MRRGHHHPERARPEVRVVALVRVHPDDPMAQPRQPLHRAPPARLGSPRSSPSEQITTIAAAAQAAPPPAAHERVERVADPGAALPVEDRLGRRACKASSGRRCSSVAGDPGQPGAEAEHLDPRGRAPGRVGELQQVARVVRHRAGDVEDQDQRPHAAAGAAARTARPARRGSASSRAPCGAGPGRGRRARGACAGCGGAAVSAGSVGMIRRSAASSSGVQAANDLFRERRRVGGQQAEPGLALLARRALPGLGRRDLQRPRWCLARDVG